ncbi:MAG: cbb3-type cytochrome oxidase assembly protein [Planctomycetes bacterium]|nr:cbb3-type cytochrome oxidase assembly protein [Planctomycetota bacterium]
MDVLIVLVFVSIVLVAGAVLLFVFALRQRDFEHAERLSLLPLLDQEPGPACAEPVAEPGGTADSKDRP